ncbi:phosphotransferase enzyme family protein [Pseudomonas sp. BGr12]|uniref:phosphotransferase enzyme family protein n=1 Tax=Pseudomonas sp. BGr12 TaxID=2936269 RepID=UPI002559A9E0|nr:phosphotransferase [Pseudomonas sp. BJa5]MDL2428473.1 phosphotransferase [Pseudomonas sp. BJa5]
MQPIAGAHFARRVLDRYPSEFRGDLTLLSFSENTTFQVSAGEGRRYVLRVHRRDYHARLDIESELAWLADLRRDGLKVPEPIAGSDGDYVQSSIDDDGEVRFFVLFHWIDGVAPNPQDNLEESFSRLGAINAILHRHSQAWQRPVHFQRMTWDHDSMVGPSARWGRWQENTHLKISEMSLIETCVNQISSSLNEYGKCPSRFGLIHADLRLANLIFDGNRTRVIDFDDCGFGWYMHDLAAALTFIEHHPKAEAWIGHWLDGYQQELSLERADFEILPSLILQRRIQVVAWLASHGRSAEAKTFGRPWIEATLQMCRRYLDGVPVGASSLLAAAES